MIKFLIYKLQWTNYNMSALSLSTKCGFIRKYKRKRVSKMAAGNWPRGRSDVRRIWRQFRPNAENMTWNGKTKH